MKILRRSVLLILPALLWMGCSNYKAVERKYRGDRAVLRIRPIDSVKATASKTFRIRSVVIEGAAMPGEPEFKKSKTLILPFGLVNYWDHQTDYVLGKHQFDSPLENDLKTSFEIGLSQFGYRKAEADPDFEIAIRARKIDSRSTYSKSGFFYFVLVAYGYSYGGHRGPYQSQVLLEIETRDRSNTYTSEIEGAAFLPLKLFHDDTDSEVERINRALALSLNNAVAKYAAIAPK